MERKIRSVILANEDPEDHILWIKACSNFKDKLHYRVVNLTKNDWYESIHSEPFDVLLAKPGGLTAPFKQLYDERIYILDHVLGYKIYPSPEEIAVYENKRLLSYWLKANNIPHPRTDVFYFKDEAMDFIEDAVFPVVAKVNIGASGSGVRILKSREEGKQYITDTFSGRGASKRWGPNLKKGGILRRGMRYIFNPGGISKKMKIYSAKKSDIQKELVIFQEFIPHEFEWRVVRIGDSFFAHKKLKIDEKASGSLLKSYDNPPLEIFDFVKEITDKHKFFSQAVDIFETEEGRYLVNEMQCIFGQSDPYQMLVDGKPGRYMFKNNEWVFEAGNYNANESYDLKVDYVCNSLMLPGRLS